MTHLVESLPSVTMGGRESPGGCAFCHCEEDHCSLDPGQREALSKDSLGTNLGD